MSKINVENKVSSKNKKRKRKLSSIQMIIIAVFAILIIGGISFYVATSNEPEARNLVVTPDNIEEILANIKDYEKAEIGSYEVYMNTTWTFPNASQPSTDAIVGNKATNSNTVYFKIKLKDSEEQVYKSPYIPVGGDLENIVLDKSLAAGRYPAVITYYLVDENFKDISHVSVNMTLLIQN